MLTSAGHTITQTHAHIHIYTYLHVLQRSPSKGLPQVELGVNEVFSVVIHSLYTALLLFFVFAFVLIITSSTVCGPIMWHIVLRCSVIALKAKWSRMNEAATES